MHKIPERVFGRTGTKEIPGIVGVLICGVVGFAIGKHAISK